MKGSFVSALVYLWGSIRKAERLVFLFPSFLSALVYLLCVVRFAFLLSLCLLLCALSLCRFSALLFSAVCLFCCLFVRSAVCSASSWYPQPIPYNSARSPSRSLARSLGRQSITAASQRRASITDSISHFNSPNGNNRPPAGRQRTHCGVLTLYITRKRRKAVRENCKLKTANRRCTQTCHTIPYHIIPYHTMHPLFVRPQDILLNPCFVVLSSMIRSVRVGSGEQGPRSVAGRQEWRNGGTAFVRGEIQESVLHGAVICVSLPDC